MPTDRELIDLLAKLRDALQTIHVATGAYHGVSATSRDVIDGIITTARDESTKALALVDDDEGRFIFDPASPAPPDPPENQPSGQSLDRGSSGRGG